MNEKYSEIEVNNIKNISFYQNTINVICGDTSSPFYPEALVKINGVINFITPDNELISSSKISVFKKNQRTNFSFNFKDISSQTGKITFLCEECSDKTQFLIPFKKIVWSDIEIYKPSDSLVTIPEQNYYKPNQPFLITVEKIEGNRATFKTRKIKSETVFLEINDAEEDLYI